MIKRGESNYPSLMGPTTISCKDKVILVDGLPILIPDSFNGHVVYLFVVFGLTRIKLFLVIVNSSQNREHFYIYLVPDDVMLSCL